MSVEVGIPDFIPTTKIIETTALEHTMMGTHDEIVNKMVAQGWEVIEQGALATSITHPLIKGTTRYLYK